MRGLCMGYSEFMIYAMYALVIWFAGKEVLSHRSDFMGTTQAFAAVLLSAMGISQAQVRGLLAM